MHGTAVYRDAMFVIPLVAFLSSTLAQGPRTREQLFELTNLSPEFQYHPQPIPGNTDPSIGWVTDENGTWTNTTGNASVSLQWWGGTAVLYGNLSRVITRIDSDHRQGDNEFHWAPDDWWNTWPQIQYTRSDEGRLRPGDMAAYAHSGIAFFTNQQYAIDGFTPYQRWNATFELDHVSSYNRIINVSRVVMGAGLPVGLTTAGSTIELFPAAADGAMLEGWTDTDDAWSVSSPAFNSTQIDTSRVGTPMVAHDILRATASSILYTNTPDASLTFSAPQAASFFVLYGAVGPDQGEFQVSLSPRQEEKDFYPHALVRNFTANRQREANDEVLAMMWLDPRLEYDVEITSKSDRNTTIQAIAWARAPQGDSEENWWSVQNERALGKPGLSGGQIAGIVVGSVLGAALVIGLVWFFWRRRGKSRAGGRALSPQTLNGEQASKTPEAV